MSGMPRPPNRPPAKRGPPANYAPTRPGPASTPRYQPAPSSDDANAYPTPYPDASDPSDPHQPSGGTDKLAHVNARVNDVKSTLQHNIQLAIQRGEHIDDMAEKSEQLAEDASTFQASARKVRQKMWVRYWKVIAGGVLLAVALIVIVVVGTSGNLRVVFYGVAVERFEQSNA